MFFKLISCSICTKTIYTIKIFLWFDVIPLSNPGKRFTTRQCQFSPLLIINKVTCFLRVKLCFDLQAMHIFLVL